MNHIPSHFETSTNRGPGAAAAAVAVASDLAHPGDGFAGGLSALRAALQALAGGRAAEWAAWSHDREWLLALRFVLVNVFALACMAAAWIVGYVDLVFTADSTHLSVAIAGVFLMGWLFACRAAMVISRELNWIRRRDSRFAAEPAENLKERLLRRISVVRQTANTLVLLGLIGTVVGFIIALAGVKPDQAGDVSAIVPMVTTLIHGMSVALYTTLVGSIFALWLTVLHRVLVSAASRLLCAARSAGYA